MCYPLSAGSHTYLPGQQIFRSQEYSAGDFFWRAFNKKGLSFKKKGSLLSVRFKEPLQLDYNDSIDNIMDKVMDAIEQSRNYMLKGKHHLMSKLDK